MNIVLQKKESAQFVQSLGGEWTSRKEEAYVFPNSLSAMMYCFEHRLPNMQIMAMFGNPKFNFTVPVTDVYAQ